MLFLYGSSNFNDFCNEKWIIDEIVHETVFNTDEDTRWKYYKADNRFWGISFC